MDLLKEPTPKPSLKALKGPFKQALNPKSEPFKGPSESKTLNPRTL